MLTPTRPSLLIASISLAALLAGPLRSENSETEAAATAPVDRLVAAVMANTPGVVSEVYTEDALVVFGPDAAVRGHENLTAAYRAFMMVQPDIHFEGHKSWVSGDVALHIAPWSMTGTAQDGSPITDSGLSVVALLRQPDGSWKMQIALPHAETLE